MRIIINADDFGISENVNSTILLLHEHGVVSSTSIMANSLSFNNAVKISKETPRLGIGVHLCLDGPYNVGSDKNSIIHETTGQFYDKHQIISKINRFSVNKHDIFKEYCLQIEKVLDHGIQISHLDHHHHLHLYFPVLNIMIKAARKFHIKNIRSQKILLPGQKKFLNAVYRKAHQRYLKSFRNTTDGYFDPCIGKESNFETHFNRLSEMLRLRNKTVELVLHPIGKNDVESRFFMSPEVIQLLRNSTIINYKDL